MFYSMSPAIDADNYYDSLCETVGTCPFCGEICQRGSERRYIWNTKGTAVAHLDCYEDATWGDLDDMDEEERDDLELWIKEFAI